MHCPVIRKIVFILNVAFNFCPETAVEKCVNGLDNWGSISISTLNNHVIVTWHSYSIEIEVELMKRKTFQVRLMKFSSCSCSFNIRAQESWKGERTGTQKLSNKRRHFEKETRGCSSLFNALVLALVVEEM